MKKIYSLLLFTFITILSFSQGTESFSNLPTAVPNVYATYNWTGDNGRNWTAAGARNDAPTSSSSVTGFSGNFIIVRNTIGIITCNGIPNGVATLSVKYAKAFTSSTGIPAFGVFINNVQIGATITASSNAASTATFTPNVTGTFNLEIRQLTANANGRLGIDDIIWTSNNSTPCPETTAQPTNLILNATSNSVTGAFEIIPSPTTVENYLVVRSLTNNLTQLPQDGTNYTAGQIINSGNGTVIAISNDGTFTDNTTMPSTEYFYFIFAMEDQACSGGPNYNITAPLTLSIITPALAACVTPTVPTTLSNPLTASNTNISGSFTSSGASKYLVIRSTTAGLGASPIGTTTYNAGQPIGNGTVVSYNASNTFSATGLTPATLYYFFVYAANENCTGAPSYSTTSLDGNQTTTNNANNIPPGYYANVNTQTCAPLKTVLFNIIKPTTANPAPTYAGICTMYPTTDFKVSDFSSNNVIWDMYSDNPAGPDPYEFEYGVDVDGCGGSGANNPPIPGSAEGILYNREHSFPQAWFGGSVEPMYSDAMHLFPTDKEVNNKRSSFPYGKVTTASFTSLNGGKLGANTTEGYSGVVFEPINEYKGDFARSHFYMITAYQDKVAGWQANKPEIFNGNAYTAFDDWYLLLMYQWHITDPVSPKEISRNDAVYVIQGNRNPYIDHPEYVNAVFQCASALPVVIASFTAKNNETNVVLNWNVTNETSFKKYQIERSVDGLFFNNIGEVESSNSTSYSFEDVNLPNKPTLYYRLKLIDINGTFTYSKILVVYINKNIAILKLYPNPTAENINIELAEIQTQGNTLYITDVTGRIIKQQLVPAFTKTLNIKIPDLTTGTYFIKLATKNNFINQSFLVIK